MTTQEITQTLAEARTAMIAQYNGEANINYTDIAKLERAIAALLTV